MNYATISTSYSVNPVCDVTDAIAGLGRLQEAVMTLTPEFVPAGPTIGVKMWFSNLQSGKESVPRGILVALRELPSLLTRGDSANEVAIVLFDMYVFLTDRTNDGATVSRGAGIFAGLVLEQLLSVRANECLQAASDVWQELLAATRNCPEGVDKCRLRLRRSVGRLGVLVQRVNLPEAYHLLTLLLRHPWPEIRNSGAFWLRDWTSPTLVSSLCAALILGIDDPIAPDFSDHLLRAIKKRRDLEALPALQALQGTPFDGELLQATVRACGGDG